MSKTRFKEDSYVNCPYYRKEDATDIKCEGLCGDHTISSFTSTRKKEECKYDFCCGLYMNCPLYIALRQNEI